MFPQTSSLVKFSTPVLVSVAGTYSSTQARKSSISSRRSRSGTRRLIAPRTSLERSSLPKNSLWKMVSCGFRQSYRRLPPALRLSSCRNNSISDYSSARPGRSEYVLFDSNCLNSASTNWSDRSLLTAVREGCCLWEFVMNTGTRSMPIRLSIRAVLLTACVKSSIQRNSKPNWYP